MADMAIYKAFGKAVATRRKKLEWTQADLAGRTGMSRAAIANIESGRQNVLLHHVYDLATALELDKVSDLLPVSTKSLIPDIDELPVSVSAEDVTPSPSAKAQISDLIAIAMARRTNKRGRA